MKKQFLKIIGSTLIVGLFLFMAFGSDDSKVDKGNNGQKSEPTNSRPTKLSDGEKKIKCLSLAIRQHARTPKTSTSANSLI